jgi:FixJ family two-component response regulator
MDQKQREIKAKIDVLTEDLDIRQSVWLEYLETDCEDVDFICKKLLIQKEVNQQIENNITAMLNSETPEDFIELLQDFTEFEQSILSLLIVGISINSIAKYKMIKPMRILQIVSNISSSPIWGEYFAKKDINSKRKIRIK